MTRYDPERTDAKDTTMDRIESDVAEWPGVSVERHSYGGCEFRLGAEQLGVLHDGPLVDVLFPKRVRDVLVAEGRNEQYHFSPGPGWMLFPVDTAADIDHAVWLFRLSYLYRAIVTPNRDAIDSDLAILDIEAELADMEMSNDLRTFFEDLLRQHREPREKGGNGLPW